MMTTYTAKLAVLAEGSSGYRTVEHVYDDSVEAHMGQSRTDVVDKLVLMYLKHRGSLMDDQLIQHLKECGRLRKTVVFTGGDNGNGDVDEGNPLGTVILDFDCAEPDPWDGGKRHCPYHHDEVLVGGVCPACKIDWDANINHAEAIRQFEGD
jgi:hypothetical protein